MARRWPVPILLLGLARVAVAAHGPAPTPTPPATIVLTASDAQLGDAFGRRVSISGNTILVGANGDDERGLDAGAAYVFERDASGAWRERQKLLPPQLLAGDFFGWSVSIKGDALVVGAPGDDRDNNGAPNAATANRGAAYVYRRVGGTWQFENRLQPPELVKGDRFGWSVAVDAPLMLVGSPGRSSTGQAAGEVFAYVAGPGGWQLDAVLARTDTLGHFGDQFGFSVALEGNVALIGSPTPPFAPGRSETFSRQNGVWSSGATGSVPGGPRDGIAETVAFGALRGMDAWADGSVGILDDWNRPYVRRVGTDGRVATMFALSPRDDWPPTSNDALATTKDGSVYVAAARSVAARRSDGTESLVASGLQRIDALAFDNAAGVLYVADHCVLRRYSATGEALTVLGVSSDCSTVDGSDDVSRLADVTAMTVADDGTALFFVERTALRRLDLRTREVTTLAPGVTAGTALAIDGSGRLLVASVVGSGHQILEFRDAGLTSIAGGLSALVGSVDGTGAAAGLSASCMAPFGNGDVAFVDGSAVRKLDGRTVTTLAGKLSRGRDRDMHLVGYDVALRKGVAVVSRPGLGPPLAASNPISNRWSATGVTLTSRGELALGQSNGCLWYGPALCQPSTAGGALQPVVLVRQDSDLRWTRSAALPDRGAVPLSGLGTTLASDGRWLVAGAPEWDYRPQDASRGDIVGTGRVFVYDLDTLDADGDTMPDAWEQQFGLDPTTRRCGARPR